MVQRRTMFWTGAKRILDSVLQEILTELQKMNARLGDIREELTDIKQAQGDDALSIVAAKLDGLKGYGTFNSISYVCHKLSQIDRIIDGIRP